ncbi:MAG: hypothetical protein CM1200mP30_03260 [Pseudomonadota bacterium]|nr:MAG: hypothetical protein CM1200mP30_03260 [Pseudomonadota bacterium]
MEREFSLAREILDPLLVKTERVTVIPGNHDRYVYQQHGTDLFTKYFLGIFLVRMKFHVSKINQEWVLVGWDSAHPNDWRTAAGTVKSSTIRATEKLIDSFPPSDKLYSCQPLPFDIS